MVIILWCFKKVWVTDKRSGKCEDEKLGTNTGKLIYPGLAESEFYGVNLSITTSPARLLLFYVDFVGNLLR